MTKTGLVCIFLYLYYIYVPVFEPFGCYLVPVLGCQSGVWEIVFGSVPDCSISLPSCV